jgi:hypothetical protein
VINFKVGDVVRCTVKDSALAGSVWRVVDLHPHNSNRLVLADPLFTPSVYSRARRIPFIVDDLERIPDAE